MEYVCNVADQRGKQKPLPVPVMNFQRRNGQDVSSDGKNSTAAATTVMPSIRKTVVQTGRIVPDKALPGSTMNPGGGYQASRQSQRAEQDYDEAGVAPPGGPVKPLPLPPATVTPRTVADLLAGCRTTGDNAVGEGDGTEGRKDDTQGNKIGVWPQSMFKKKGK